MTERELSQKLEELATRLESEPDDFMDIAAELRKLSALKYTPGHTSWDDVKKQAKPTKSRFPF
jgi:hypothetical protein